MGLGFVPGTVTAVRYDVPYRTVPVWLWYQYYKTRKRDIVNKIISTNFSKNEPIPAIPLHPSYAKMHF